MTKLEEAIARFNPFIGGVKQPQQSYDYQEILKAAKAYQSMQSGTAVDAKPLAERIFNVVSALGMVRTFFADYEGDAEAAENLESALSVEQKKLVAIAMEVAALSTTPPEEQKDE